MACSCPQQADTFLRPTLVFGQHGKLFLLVRGAALSAASVEVVAGKHGSRIVRAEVPLQFCDVLDWKGLVAKRLAAKAEIAESYWGA